MSIWRFGFLWKISKRSLLLLVALLIQKLDTYQLQSLCFKAVQHLQKSNMACRWSSQHKLKWLSVRILSNRNLLAFWSWIMTGTCLNHAIHCQFSSSQCLFFVYLPINVLNHPNHPNHPIISPSFPHMIGFTTLKKKLPPKPSQCIHLVRWFSERNLH